MFFGGILILIDRLRQPVERVQQEMNLRSMCIRDWGVQTDRDFLALFFAFLLLFPSAWVLLYKPDGSRAIYGLLGALWFAWVFLRRRLNGLNQEIWTEESEEGARA